MVDLTADEIVVLIESLREYRLRVAEPNRRVLCDALIYRLGAKLLSQEKERVLNGPRRIEP